MSNNNMAPEVTLITPTGDRPEGIKLVIQWMARQSFNGSVQWIISDDSRDPSVNTGSVLGMSPIVQQIDAKGTQFIIRGNPDFHIDFRKRINGESQDGPRSLAGNLIDAIPGALGQVIIIIEDDDWYSANHLSEMHHRLQYKKVVGTIWQNYYHLPSLSYRVFRNVGSALCSTGFVREFIPEFLNAAYLCGRKNAKGIDRYFWDSIKDENDKDIYEPTVPTVIGMKGLPGRKGIGIGHVAHRFQPDPEAQMLRTWVKDDADTYLDIRRQFYEEKTT